MNTERVSLADIDPLQPKSKEKMLKDYVYSMEGLLLLADK